MNPKARKIILKAIDLLETYGWTRGSYAQDKFGRQVPISSKEAACFCTVGALQRARYDLDINDRRVFKEAYFAVDNAMNPAIGVVSYNDRYANGKHDVISKLRKAAENV